MSQSGTTKSSGSGPIPGNVATSYVTNSGTAVPSVNVLNVLGSTVVAGSTPLRSIGSGNTVTYQTQLSQAIASTDATKVGLAAFSSSQFSVDANGFVSLVVSSNNYTNVTGPIVYTVLTTDSYISCNTSGGAITLNFPNSPTFKQQWIVKDRTGNASVNHITITTAGASDTFDGSTSYVIAGNYGSVNLIANNSSNYEVF